MDSNDTKLLEAIYSVKNELGERMTALETTIESGVNGRFKDLERRTSLLEKNQRWLVTSIIGMFLAAVGSLVIK